MKQLLHLLLFVLFTLNLSIAQTQLHIEGTNAKVPVAKIDVNYSDGLQGIGVNGLEINISSTNWNNGIYVNGSKGNGVNVNMAGLGTGGYFKTNGGIGVEGTTHSTENWGYGVKGVNSRIGNGTGVYGIAEGSSGNNFGVKGISQSVTGIGVYGEAAADSGDGFGVKGSTLSPTGTGVYGSVDATSPLGESYGVHGKANSPNGAGVYGENDEGVAVFGYGRGNGAGVKGQGYTSVGGYFLSEESYGLQAESDFEYGISASSNMKAAGYFKGSATIGKSDIVLGVDGETEGADDGVISSDLNMKSSDVHVVSNDRLIFKLDQDEVSDGEDSYLQVLNGAGDKIMTLDENGNLEITGIMAPTSDRNAKYDIMPVEYSSVLDKLMSMEVFEWKYKGQKETHLGPMAQDFFAAFKLNDDDTKIATVDIDGVALASIKALYNLVLKQGVEIKKLRSLIDQIVK